MDYILMGQRIRHFRVTRKLTQEQLAEAADISASFMGHIERGNRISSIETLVKLCAALEVTPNDLLWDDTLIQTADMPELVSISPRRLLSNMAVWLRKQENR